MKVLLVILCLALVSANETQNATENDLNLFGREFVELINRSNLTWKAKLNFEGADMDFLKSLTGTQLLDFNPSSDRICKTKPRKIPESFNAIENWPECSAIIGHISDQSACGSCWGVSSAASISDNICVATGGKHQVLISGYDIACNTAKNKGFSCNGGNIKSAYEFWKNTGVVSGGDFNDKGTCISYPFKSAKFCNFFKNAENCPIVKKRKEPVLYQCVQSCENGEDYQNSRYFAKDYCKVAAGNYWDSNESAIQREIMTHGSVTAGFKTYKSFRFYSGGIYIQQPVYRDNYGRMHIDKKVGGHAIKLFGWGVEEIKIGENEFRYIKYWLAANSWGKDWGYKGFFKILRGEDNCRIESHVWSGVYDGRGPHGPHWPYD